MLVALKVFVSVASKDVQWAIETVGTMGVSMGSSKDDWKVVRMAARRVRQQAGKLGGEGAALKVVTTGGSEAITMVGSLAAMSVVERVVEKDLKSAEKKEARQAYLSAVKTGLIVVAKTDEWKAVETDEWKAYPLAWSLAATWAGMLECGSGVGTDAM